MKGLTLYIYNWLKEINELEAAKFLTRCDINNSYVTSFLSTDADMFDVIIYVPLKDYKKLEDYNELTSQIEEAIREFSDADGVYVREINWKPRIKSTEEKDIEDLGEDVAEQFNEEYVWNKVNIMTNSIKTNPHLAIGTAKELIETCCKSILRDNKIEVDKNWNILKLVKETNKQLNLVPFDIEESEKAGDAVTKILSGFSTITHGITELRNEFGSGHGHYPDFKELDKLYASLAVAASSHLVRFYINIIKLDSKNS